MILIGTPTREAVHGGTAYDLVYLMRATPSAQFSIAFGTLLSNLRAQLAQAALRLNADHLLFIDSDMRFPPDTLDRLLARDCAIVGANCTSRTQNRPTARRGASSVSSAGKTGIEAVDVLGFGVTLINTQVFRVLTEPWFAMPWDGTKHVGEDVYFCREARAAGFKIMVDHDLSHGVRHVGAIELEAT